MDLISGFYRSVGQFFSGPSSARFSHMSVDMGGGGAGKSWKMDKQELPHSQVQGLAGCQLGQQGQQDASHNPAGLPRILHMAGKIQEQQETYSLKAQAVFKTAG